jgi:hypothetical protein
MTDSKYCREQKSKWFVAYPRVAPWVSTARLSGEQQQARSLARLQAVQFRE